MTCVLRRPTDYAIYSFCQPQKERERGRQSEEGDSATNSASPWKKSSRGGGGGGGGGMQIFLGWNFGWGKAKHFPGYARYVVTVGKSWNQNTVTQRDKFNRNRISHLIFTSVLRFAHAGQGEPFVLHMNFLKLWQIEARKAWEHR